MKFINPSFSLSLFPSFGNRDQTESPVNNGGGDNPFGDHDEGEDVGEEEPPNQGWAVRALYDYIHAEDDELDFKAGKSCLLKHLFSFCECDCDC